MKILCSATDKNDPAVQKHLGEHEFATDSEFLRWLLARGKVVLQGPEERWNYDHQMFMPVDDVDLRVELYNDFRE